jgi:hypothetical protein
MKRWIQGIAALAIAATTVTGLPAAATAGASGETVSEASAHASVPPGGRRRYVNKRSGKCMNIPGGSTADGARVTQFTCGGWMDHKWEAEPAGGPFYRIRNANSGKCLAVPGGTTERGVQLIQWPCGDWEDHRWRFQQYPDGRFQVINMKSGQCLAVRGGDVADGAAVIQWPCGGWDDHFWALEPA